MNLDIKMEVIANETKGHRRTKIGLLPEDWKVVNIGDVSSIDRKSLASNTENDFRFKYVSLSDINNGKINKNLEFVRFEDAPSRARRIVSAGNILMATVRPNLKSFGFINSLEEAIIASTGFAVIEANDRCDGKFLFYNLFSCNVEGQIFALVVGSNYPAINSKDVRRLKIPLPPLPEQEKIAKILTTWDRAISASQNLIERLQQRKKGLMQQLMTEKLRLNGFNEKWEPQRLSFYLESSKLKNFDLKYGIKDVLSVSGEFGIVNQIEFQGRSFAGKSVANYGIVEKGDVVYTKSPLKLNPYGIIKLNKGKNGIVSTLYTVYKCKPTVDGEYLDYYFELDDHVNSYLRPLVQKGTKNDMKINNEKVLIDEVKFPSLMEQKAIVKVLKSADKEIDFQQAYLEQLKTQKKGLLQQLLTGGKRVKIN